MATLGRRARADKPFDELRMRMVAEIPVAHLVIGELLARKKSPFRITPDGRLTRRALEGEPAEDGLALASRMLNELESCVKGA